MVTIAWIYGKVTQINNKKNINYRVFKGIRKTINRFREKPLYYFTEADIHSSLVRDILQGSSNELIYKKNNSKKNILLLHQEFPTSFRYIPAKIKEGFYKTNIIEKTDLSNSKNGARGHYDLVVINPSFVKKMLANQNSDEKAIKHIMNKSIANTKANNNELLFAIEVKFLHLFNIKNKSMEKEIEKDNEKLRISSVISNRKIKCINLVFCSAKDTSNNVLKNIIIQNKNSHVLNIFIKSYYDDNNKKQTVKPITNFNSNTKWGIDLVKGMDLTNNNIN